VYCSHFTLENPKRHFQQYYSYIDLLKIIYVIYVISEENKLQLLYIAAYLFTYYCLLLPIICVALFYSKFFFETCC